MTSFFNSYIGSDMEPSVILISPKNKSPSDFWINESIYARILSFLVYIGFWIFILHGMMKWAPGGYPINIKIGFSVGFLLLLLYDFLYNYASQIMIDAQEKKFTEMNILSTNVVLNNKFILLNVRVALLLGVIGCIIPVFDRFYYRSEWFSQSWSYLLSMNSVCLMLIGLSIFSYTRKWCNKNNAYCAK
jgi:hypothetical protein